MFYLKALKLYIERLNVTVLKRENKTKSKSTILTFSTLADMSNTKVLTLTFLGLTLTIEIDTSQLYNNSTL